MVGAQAPAGARRRRRWGGGDTGAAVVFLGPSFLFLTAFIFFPLVYLFYISVLNWNLLSPPTFAGMHNYTHLLASPYFLNAVRNTVLFTVGAMVLILPAAFAAAMLLNVPLRERALYRSALFAPYVFPLVASGVAWSLMFQPQVGIVDWVLSKFGIHGPNWLSSGHWALIAVIIVTAWQYFGFYALIFLAGLQALPGEIMEAADVDGAGGLTKTLRITLPLISPSFFFAMVILVIGSFQVFTQVFVMTSGGPGSSTTTIVYYLYREAFQYFEMGRAAAVAVMLLLGLVVMTLLQLWASRRWVHHEA